MIIPPMGALKYHVPHIWDELLVNTSEIKLKMNNLQHVLHMLSCVSCLLWEASSCADAGLTWHAKSPALGVQSIAMGRYP